MTSTEATVGVDKVQGDEPEAAHTETTHGDSRKETPASDDICEDNKAWIKDQPFRLLDLPPELWVRICQLAVTNSIKGSLHKDADVIKAFKEPGIIQVSRAIRHETPQQHYANERIFVENGANGASDMYLRLHNMGWDRIRSFSNVVVDSVYDDAEDFLKGEFGGVGLAPVRVDRGESDEKKKRVYADERRYQMTWVGVPEQVAEVDTDNLED